MVMNDLGMIHRIARREMAELSDPSRPFTRTDIYAQNHIGQPQQSPSVLEYYRHCKTVRLACFSKYELYEPY